MLYRKYLLTQFWQVFGLVTFILTSIVILSQFLKFINQYISKGFDISNIILLLILILPSLLVYIAPITVFCTIFFVYHKMITDSELVILESNGLSKYKLAMPAITFAVMIMIASYFTTIFVTPYFKRELQEQQSLIRENYISSMLEEKVFNNLSKNLTIYIDKQLPNGNLQGIIIYDQRNNIPAIITAQTAKLIPKLEALSIELYSGSRQNLNNQSQLEMLFFDSSVLNIQYRNIGEIEHIYSPEELYINELIFHSTSDPEMKNTIHYEIHQRLSWPLLNLTLAAVALAAILSMSYNREWKYKKVVVGGIAATAVILLNFIFTSKSENSLFFTITLYLNLFFVTWCCMYFLKRRCDHLDLLPPKMVKLIRGLKLK